MTGRLIWPLMAMLLLLASGAARAHQTPNSELKLDFGRDQLIADIIIPQGEYRYVTGNPVDNGRPALAEASAFLKSGFFASTPAGERWNMVVEKVEFVQIAGPPDLHAVVRLTPPPGRSERRLTIHWSAVIDRLPSHFVLVAVRTDFAAGKLDGKRQLLGSLRGGQRTLDVDRGERRPWAGFVAAVALGMAHIAEGHDHLLFLIALILPVGLTATAGRWAGPLPLRRVLGRTGLTVTGFTIGHSITLVAVALFGARLPPAPVEVAIALSILLSALHAWRPLFPGREPIVAAAFGLVHGLAFGTIIARFGLGAGEQGISILGFNLGIEFIQIAVVVAVLPALLLVSRLPNFQLIRTCAAALVGVAALAWLAERLTATANPVSQAIGEVLAYSPALLVLGNLIGISMYLQHKRNRPAAA